MTGLREQLGQSRRQHGDRQLCLAGAVERGNQRGELRPRHVLQFINKEHERGGALMRRLAEDQQEIRKIGVEIAAVGQAGFRLGLNAELDIPIFDLERPGKARQRAHALQRMILQRLAATQTQKRRAQRRNEQGRQRSLFGGFHFDADDAARLGVEPDAVQQDGFADPAQPIEDKAAGRSAGANPVERHRGPLDEFVAPRKRGRGRARARRVRIESGIHIKTVYPDLLNFDKVG